LRIPAFSPDKPPAVAAATSHLIGFGHRRIVLLVRKIRRLPRPGLSETVFLETLRAHDCPAGEYNLPYWEETNEGFQECLRALFRVTPPTALIVDETPYVVAAMQFLLSRGIRVPTDVSLISTDDDPAFAHCHPPMACITWDTRPATRRILQWAANVSRGKPDLRQTLTPARFIPGGTVARAPG
jgi:LacI family transcriptional regulator